MRSHLTFNEKSVFSTGYHVFSNYANIKGCAINGDTEFYSNDIGQILYAPYGSYYHSFNGAARPMKNLDPSDVACGEYYYDPSIPRTEPCVVYAGSGTQHNSVIDPNGAVTIIIERCAEENLPLDDDIWVMMVIVGGLGACIISKRKLLF